MHCYVHSRAPPPPWTSSNNCGCASKWCRAIATSSACCWGSSSNACRSSSIRIWYVFFILKFKPKYDAFFFLSFFFLRFFLLSQQYYQLNPNMVRFFFCSFFFFYRSNTSRSTPIWCVFIFNLFLVFKTWRLNSN